MSHFSRQRQSGRFRPVAVEQVRPHSVSRLERRPASARPARPAIKQRHRRRPTPTLLRGAVRRRMYFLLEPAAPSLVEPPVVVTDDMPRLDAVDTSSV